MDTLEEKNDNIKERLLELLNIVKINRDQLDEVDSNLTSDSSQSTLTSLREQLNEMEECMTKVMLPRTTLAADMSSLREQLNQMEENVAQAADGAGSLSSCPPGDDASNVSDVSH